jgi:hypothetical protein
VPTGGSTGQVLTKIDATNYNTNWQTPATGVTWPLLAPPDTTASAPQYTFAGRTGVGIYSPAASTLGFATGGAEQFRITNNVFLFSQPAARITGDFSNATHSNRVLFQTSTLNSSTVVGIMPNGTGAVGQLNVYNNSAPDGAPAGQFAVNATSVLLNSSGTLPIIFNVGGAERMRVDSASALTVAGAGVFGTNVTATGKIAAGPLLGSTNGDLSANRSDGTGYVVLGSAARYVGYNGSSFLFGGAGLAIPNGDVTIQSGNLLLNSVAGQSVWATYYNSANTQHRMAFSNSVAVTNTNVLTLFPTLGYGNLMGLAIIIDISTGNQALYWLRGGAQSAVLIHGQGFTWTTTFGSAGINVNFSGSASNYILENKTGVTVTIRSIYIGII